MLTEEDLVTVYGDITRVIMILSTESSIKKIKHNYFLTRSELEAIDKIYPIFAAELRQGIERVFEHYWDQELVAKVKAETEARKAKYAGRGRRKKTATQEPVSTIEVGGLTIETFDE